MREICRVHPICRRRGVSVVISTLILSASVLAVTAIASFVALNVLELQSQQTEFEQARSNMQILSEIIEDIGVKPGAGSFIRFNERTGGIGYANGTNGHLRLIVYNGTDQANKIINLTRTPLDITYRGGRMVSTYNQTVKGENKLIIPALQNSTGFLRQRQKDGAWLNLDFNRIRIVNGATVNVGSSQYQLVMVTFFNVTYGKFTGTGNLDVKVQNKNLTTWAPLNYSHDDPLTASSNRVNVTLLYGDVPQILPPVCEMSKGCLSITQSSDPSIKGVIVIVTISDLEVSTL